MREKLHPFWHEEVRYLPLWKPVVVQEKDTIESAILKMQEKISGCLLVVNENNSLVGIVTERDFMRLYIGTDLSSSTLIEEIMVRDVFTIEPSLRVTDVLNLFGTKPFRHLPVCHNGSILGLLSVRVLIDFIAEHLPEETLNLSPLLGDVPKEPFGA